MATVTVLYGTSPVTVTATALQSLAASAFWKSPSVNFSTNSAVFVTVQVVLTTASTTAGSATGYSNVYLAQSPDGTTFDANITAGDAVWSSTNPTTAEYAKALLLLGRIPMGTTQTASYVWGGSFVLPIGGYSKYGVFVVENQSGKALAASGSSITYMENRFTVA